MKRFHVHVGVEDLDASVKFYSTLFAAEPTVLKPDYAKWMLDDPRVNFAISARGRATGLDHLGIQVESDGELRDIALRLRGADRVVFEQKAAACCYANSDKAWVADPQGVAWETFLTLGDATVYGDDSVETDRLTRVERAEAASLSAACCDRAATRAVS
jgi:catechol 2,3-dioxygenase-like lactoylglutathione lyase family enzyme